MSQQEEVRNRRTDFISLFPLPASKEILPAFLFLSFASLIYFASRLYHLTVIPIFTDEAIYLRWAQIALRDPQLRFISLTDGKQPLFVWLAMVAMKFINDPLVAGRLVSVIAGWFGLIGVWLLAREFFNKRIGYFTALVYLFTPIIFLYNRMALMEGLLFTIGTWALFFSVLLVKHLRLDLALVLGAVVGAALLTKSSGMFYLYLLPATLPLFDWKEKQKIKRLLAWFLLAGVVFTVSQVFFNFLRLSPWFHMIKIKDHTFILTWSEFLKNPWQWLPGNLRAFNNWLIGYLTLPLVLFMVFGFSWQLKKDWRQNLVLLAYFIIPLLASAALGKVIYARYLMFFVLPLLIFAGRGLAVLTTWLTNRLGFSSISTVLLSLVFLVPAVKVDGFLLSDPRRALIPDNDKNQYIDEWPSGYGAFEVVSFLKDKVEEGKVTVATEGTFGLMPFSLELYLVDHPNVEILSFWPVSKIPDEVVERARDHPTYFVFNETQEISADYPLRLIAKYPKGNGKTFLRLFEVLAEKETS